MCSFWGFLRAPQEWWRLIPAWTLVALGGMILTTALPTLDPRLSAALLFLGLAIAFGHIYLLERRERWWALIPAGFLLVLGVVIGLSSRITSSEQLAAILFAGMGGVFFALYIFGDRSRQWWALMPGTVLLVFGALAVASGQAEASFVSNWWPVVLIAIGVLVWFSARRPAVNKLTINSAPQTRRSPEPVAEIDGRRGRLGDYTGPAPGASVEILPDDE